MNTIFNIRFLLTTITLNNFEKDPIYKKILISFFLSSFASTNAYGNSAVLGLGLDSCAKVIENVEKNDNMGAAFKTAYTSYIMGFFSGVNVVYEDDTGLEVFEDLYSEILANCKAAPDASFIAAIINLYAEQKN